LIQRRGLRVIEDAQESARTTEVRRPGRPQVRNRQLPAKRPRGGFRITSAGGGRALKSGAAANEAVAGGHVQVGGARVKPAKAIHVGDTVLIRNGGDPLDRALTALGDARIRERRGDALRGDTESLAPARRSDSSAATPDRSAPTSARGRRAGPPCRSRRCDEVSGDSTL